MAALASDKFWVDKSVYHDAEKKYHEAASKLLKLGSKHEAVNKKPKEKNHKCSNKTQKLEMLKQELEEIEDTQEKNVAKKSGEGGIAKKHKDNKENVETITEEVAPKKLKGKEAKEKKNKSEKKNKKKEVDIKEKEGEGKQGELKKRGGVGQSSAPSCVANMTCPLKSSLASEVARARQHIKSSLECIDGIAALSVQPGSELGSRVATVEQSSTQLSHVVKNLQSVIERLEQRVADLEIKLSGGGDSGRPTKPPPPKEDDVDLFLSDSEEEDEGAKKVREQRLAEYEKKKSKKPTLIAKSNIILDVKPWDDETDMKQMEVEVRKVVMDGLVWGASKLVPLAYGIHKLQISCVVEDEKVSVDDLTQSLEDIEQFVQSVDIAAFNKV